MESLGGLWGIATIVGPIVLLAVIIWAWASNRSRSAATEQEADAAAARLNEQIQREDERRGNG